MQPFYLLSISFLSFLGISHKIPDYSSREPIGLFAAATDSIVPPAHFTKLKEAKGDLDRDNRDEVVVVYDTGRQTDMGTERQLFIYRQEGNGWKVWHKCTGPVLASEHGGLMGDPFEAISVERGAIVIGHFGGSRDKWTYTHRYRFQSNSWYLIGATINFGAPCDRFENYDYNLSTGVINASITTEKCSGDSDQPVSSKEQKFSFVQKPAKPVLMDGFVPGEHEVPVKKTNGSFYF